MTLPDLEDPLPDNWQTLEVGIIRFLTHYQSCIQGPFFNVYACKQPWLDYQMYFCPEARPDDGRLWLVVMDHSWKQRGPSRIRIRIELVLLARQERTLDVEFRVSMSSV